VGQFHVTVYVTNPRFAHLATEAMLDRTLITMSSNIDGGAGPVTGFIQSIEEDAYAVPTRRWRITILEDDERERKWVRSATERNTLRMKVRSVNSEKKRGAAAPSFKLACGGPRGGSSTIAVNLKPLLADLKLNGIVFAARTCRGNRCSP
jgi:hypothetical protein